MLYLYGKLGDACRMRRVLFLSATCAYVRVTTTALTLDDESARNRMRVHLMDGSKAAQVVPDVAVCDRQINLYPDQGSAHRRQSLGLVRSLPPFAMRRF